MLRVTSLSPSSLVCSPVQTDCSAVVSCVRQVSDSKAAAVTIEGVAPLTALKFSRLWIMLCCRIVQPAQPVFIVVSPIGPDRLSQSLNVGSSGPEEIHPYPAHWRRKGTSTIYSLIPGEDLKDVPPWDNGAIEELRLL